VEALVEYVLDQAFTPFCVGVVFVAASAAALLHRNYSRRIAVLLEEIKQRDVRLAQLEERLQTSKVNELQSKVANLNPQPRRRLTAQQKSLLAEYASVPPDRQFTMEVIHDMAGSDCSAYANDLRDVFDAIGGWSVIRSAVLRPGWVARCGLGVHVQNRDILSRPETTLLNALAAAGLDYDLVRIPELDADVALLVTPIPAHRLQPQASAVNSADLRLAREPDPQMVGLEQMYTV
jgi:hypothetical protein